MSALRLLTALFDVDTASAVTSLKKLDTGIATAKASLGTMAASLVGAFSLNAAKHFIGEQIELGSQINDTSDRLGVATDALQKFQLMTGLSGVEATGAATALQFLNKNLGGAIAGGAEQAKIFADLGVNLKDVKDGTKGAADIIPDIAKKFEELGSDAERTDLAMKLFGRQGAALIPFLKQGSEEVAKLEARFEELGGGLKNDFIKAADEAGDELDLLKFAMTGLKSRIALAVLPSITEAAKKFQGWVMHVVRLTKETHIVKEGLALVGIVGAAAGLKTALAWGKFFGIFPKGNAGILKTLASMGWIGVIIALVAVLALVFEDLFIGIEGGNSIIRRWLNETLGVEDTNALFEQLGQVVEQIKSSFENMSPAVKSLMKMLAEIAVSPAFIASIEFIVRLLGSMVALLVAAARAAGNIVTGDFAGAGKAIDQGGDAVFGKNGFFGEAAFKPYAPRAPAPAVTSPGGAFQRPAEINAPVNNVFNITGAGDPSAVGRRVAAFQRESAAQNAQALGGMFPMAAGDDE